MKADVLAQLDPQAVARTPRQQRARERFEAVLAEAETVLAESGLAGFSIPVIAERLRMTRGSVYAYFPTPYAILNELVIRYTGEMEAIFQKEAAELARRSWWDAVDYAVSCAVTYHNQNPVARLLMLGGAVTDAGYRSTETLLKRLGTIARGLWAQRPDGGQALPEEPDVFTLGIDMAVASFRRSVFEHGEIRPEYQEAAVVAMRSFLQSYLDVASGKSKA